MTPIDPSPTVTRVSPTMSFHPGRPGAMFPPGDGGRRPTRFAPCRSSPAVGRTGNGRETQGAQQEYGGHGVLHLVPVRFPVP